jgi:hypothetical protein
MTFADVVVIGGGQAGLATAHAALARGLRPVVLDASGGGGGSWPRHYDSLTLFSPARFSSLPGMAFPGDPERYPVRDEVVAYLDAYARRLDAEVRWNERVDRVAEEDGGFTVSTTSGAIVRGGLVVAAGGGFSRPYRPALPGLDTFTGRVLHSAEYRQPAPFVGGRVVVVGGGNSAVQIAVELAQVATVSISTRGRLRWQPQRILGRDFHWWLAHTGLDTSALGPRLVKGGVPVIDESVVLIVVSTVVRGRCRWPSARAVRCEAPNQGSCFRPGRTGSLVPTARARCSAMACRVRGATRGNGLVGRPAPHLGSPLRGPRSRNSSRMVVRGRRRHCSPRRAQAYRVPGRGPCPHDEFNLRLHATVHGLDLGRCRNGTARLIGDVKPRSGRERGAIARNRRPRTGCGGPARHGGAVRRGPPA